MGSSESGPGRLVRVIQDLSRVKSLDEIMMLVRTAARDIAEADGATFVLKDNGFCYYADEDAISPLWKGQRFPLQACVSGWAMGHKEQVLIPDIYRDARVPISAYRPTFVKSLMMTPIRKEDPIGAIGTYWKKKHSPSVEQQQMLQALADSVSVAMENVELYSSLQKRVEELARANHAKDEFLMMVSHELRTPMNSILGWSELLLAGAGDAGEVKSGLEAIERNARQESHILDELLDTSQILMNRLQMEKVDIDLLPILRDAVSFVQEKALKKGIRIDFSQSVNRAMVHADPARLHQIFEQLLSNAIKFSRNNQSISVYVVRSGPGVQIRIRDEGAGIDPEVLPHIFERFERGDSSMTREYGGLGLGLTIVQALVEAHQGHVKIESEGLGKGTLLTVIFPLQVAQEASVGAVS